MVSQLAQFHPDRTTPPCAMQRPLVFTPPVDPEGAVSEPEVLASQRALLLGVAPLVVPVLGVPEPAGSCDESAGPFVTPPPVAPVPVEPYTAPDPAVIGSQRPPPDGESPEPAAAGGEAVPDEPGVGLEQVRRIPLGESSPVTCGAVASPAELHVSGPTPASIARGSSDSALVRVVVRRRGPALRSRLISCPPATPVRTPVRTTCSPPLLGETTGRRNGRQRTPGSGLRNRGRAVKRGLGGRGRRAPQSR